MAIVQSRDGTLRAVTDPPPDPLYGTSGGSVAWSGEYCAADYAYIYATQPNIRICVEFLGRNIAMVPVHAYRRVSDVDRVRLADLDVIQWLDAPNPATTNYRLIESLVCDVGVFQNAYWWKVRANGRVSFVRLPPEEVAVAGGLLPREFLWTSVATGETRHFPPEDIVHFSGYNPLNPLVGLSGLRTLADILAEEYAATTHRQQYWANASRIDGVIERPREAPKWTREQKTDWRRQWQEQFGAGGTRAGQTAVLEDGMTFKPTTFNARDSQYIEGGKLRREVCAAEYHIPQPFVGILEHATFSNIKEQHKQLYQDTLGPWFAMIGQELERQVLIESADPEDVYLEFNIAAKMQGAFEEQANSLRLLVGRPIMTANEGRARLNLPQADDPSADEIAPQQGGPSVVAVDPAGAAAAQDAASSAQDGLTASIAATIVRTHWARQAIRVAKVSPAARADALQPARCTAELADDLRVVLPPDAATAYATRITDETYTWLVEGRDPFTPDRPVPPVQEDRRHAA